MAADDAQFERARLFARGALLLSLIFGSLVVAHAAASWDAIPDRVPMHFNASGAPDDWARKSFPAIFVMPLMALLMPVGVAALGLASVSPANLPGEDRPELRRALPVLANFLSGLAVLATLLLSGAAFGATRVAAGKALTLGWLPMVGGIGLGLWAIVGSFWLLAKHTPIHAAKKDADDAARWKWGAFYYAPDDPSLFVEKRWGGGYTVNFGTTAGRRLGWAMLAFFLAMGGLVAWVIAASGS